MKLNAHIEEVYGSDAEDIAEPSICLPSAAFSRPWSIADRHHEDEIIGGAHRNETLHSNMMEYHQTDSSESLNFYDTLFPHMEHLEMNTSEPEKLILWFDDLHAGTRFFLVTAPLRQADKQLHTFAAVASPIYRPIRGKSTYAGDFTENTIDLVNALFKIDGIKFVFCNAYALQIRLRPDASWASLHDRVVNLLNASLFGGQAAVGVFTQPQADIRQCWKHLSHLSHLSLAKSEGEPAFRHHIDEQSLGV